MGDTSKGEESSTKARDRSNTEEVIIVKDEGDLFLDTETGVKGPSILCAFEDEEPVPVSVSKVKDKEMLLAQMKAHFQGLAHAMANDTALYISYVDSDGDTVQLLT